MAIEESLSEFNPNEENHSDLKELEIDTLVPRKRAMVNQHRFPKRESTQRQQNSRKRIASSNKRRNSADTAAKNSLLITYASEYYQWNPMKVRFSAPSILHIKEIVSSANEAIVKEQKQTIEEKESTVEPTLNPPTQPRTTVAMNSQSPEHHSRPRAKFLATTQVSPTPEKTMLLPSEKETRSRLFSQRIKPLGKEKVVLDSYITSTLKTNDNKANGSRDSATNTRKTMFLSATQVPNLLSKEIGKSATRLVLNINNAELQNMDPSEYVAKIGKELRGENIFDCHSKDEILSDEPFIILKNAKDTAHTSKTKIRAIDIQKLIDLMCKYIPTADGKDDDDHHMRIKIMTTFFITHDMCISAVELLKEIAKRLLIPFPAAMSEQERKHYRTNFLKPLQFQVLDVFAHWIKARPDDFRPDGLLAELFAALYEYTADILIDSNKLGFELLLPDRSKVNRLARGSQSEQDEMKIPKSLLNNHVLTLDEGSAVEIFVSYSPDLMANQMTRIDLEYLNNVRVCDLPHNLKNRRVNSNNRFQRMIEYTNYLTFFWINTILGVTENKKKKLVAWLLETAERLLFLNNFHSFSIIMGALTNVALRGWMYKELDRRSVTWHRFTTYEELYCDVAHFRKKIHDASCPKIPSIMVISEDITKMVALFDEFQIRLETRKLIDFQVMEEIAELIDSLLNKQHHMYNPIECNTRLHDLLVNEPRRVMRSLDHDMNISRVQTKLMAKNSNKKKSFLESIFI